MTTKDVSSVRGKRAVLAINAAANLGRALSGSFENLLVPLILLWMLPRDAYGVWAVIFSVSTYVTYLDLGLQAAVQANVARWVGLNDAFGAARIAWAGVKAVLFVAAVAFGFLVWSAVRLDSIFPAIPSALAQQGSLALVILTVGQAANLAINVLSAYYAGHQRSVFPSMVMATARAVSLVSIVGVGLLDRDLAALAVGYSLPLALGFLLLLGSFFKEFRGLRRGAIGTERVVLKGTRVGHLLRYSGPLMVWNVCTLVVTAAGTAIVGRVDFKAVVVYSIATIFVLSIAGVDNAIMSPLLSELGYQAAQGDRVRLSRTVVVASRINAVVLGVLVIVGSASGAALAASGFLQGSDGTTSLIVVGLILAGSIRLTMTPLTFGFVATATHHRVVFQPMIEAAVNLAASISFGLLFGAAGVVAGGLLAGILGVIMAVAWSRHAAGFSWTLSASHVSRSVSIPMACTIPAVTMALIEPWMRAVGSGLFISAVVLSVLLSFGLVWTLSISHSLKLEITGRLRIIANRIRA
ncbi:MAG: hypothetical protein EPN48_06580 [Microbacteriaceae bacterium]|nr:MAG: hypothetical protein EPN48_06580 [Microbacteriaceae bacterium]